MITHDLIEFVIKDIIDPHKFGEIDLARFGGQIVLEGRGIAMEKIVQGDGELLFGGEYLSDVLNGEVKRACAMVNQISATQILNVSETDLVDSLVDKYTIPPVDIQKEEIYLREPVETSVDVSRSARYGPLPGTLIPGVKISVDVPFLGPKRVFQLRPPTFSVNAPRARIEGQELILDYIQIEPDASAIEQEYMATLVNIESHLSSGRPIIEQYAQNLRGAISNAVQERKKRLLADLPPGLKPVFKLVLVLPTCQPCSFAEA